MLLNQDIYWGMIDELMQRPSPIGNVLVYLSGLLSLLAGLAMVNVHFSWTRDWRVIITVIGWLILIGGILSIVLPQITLKVGSKMYASPSTMVIVAIIALGLGGFLTLKGYWTET